MRVRATRRVGLYAVIPLVSLTLGIGMMHFPAARPLLVWLRRSARSPQCRQPRSS